jgi:hypothetical protein
MNMVDRYLARVVKSEGCWSWPGSKTNGYGVIWGDGKMQQIHRVSWEFHNGNVPDGMCVLHHCDNRECSNPSHLFLGGRGDNNKDRASKGRSRPRRGEDNGMAKLTAKRAAAIKALYQFGLKRSWLARSYGVSVQTVYEITKGITWCHVSPASL